MTKISAHIRAEEAILDLPEAINAELEQMLSKLRLGNQNKEPGMDLLAANLLSKAQEVHNSVYEAEALHEQAIIELNLNSDFDAALELVQKSITLFSADSNPILFGRINKTLGIIFYYKGVYFKSQEYYLEAVKLLEFLPKKQPYLIEELARIYHGLSILHDVSHFEELRKKYLGKALDYALQSGSKPTISRCYNAFAIYYSVKKDYDLSLQYYRKSLDLAIEMNDQNMISVCYNNLGICYADTGKVEEGMDFLFKALELKKQLGKVNQIGFTHIHIGKVYFDIENYRDSITHFCEAIRLLKSINSQLEIHSCYLYLSQAYAKLNDYKTAYDYRILFEEAQSDSQNFDKAAAIIDAQNKFELEKRDKEAQLLRHKNMEIERYTYRLESSNKELKQFAHIASHDLKEPLRMVSSYVTLLDKKLKEKLDDEERIYMDFVLDGTKRMYSLINDILEISKISVESIYKDVNLHMVVEEVKRNIAPEVRSCVEIDIPKQLPVISADSTQMLQLFQNMISNALKYNRSDIPRVSIKYTEHDGFYDFSIADNGIGILPEYRDKVFVIFQRLHSRNEFSGTGIGLAICKKIVDNMNGKIWVEGNEHYGSTFRILVPVKQPNER